MSVIYNSTNNNSLSATITVMPIVERLLSFLAPHECMVCGDEGSLVCALCAEDTLVGVPERCYRCLSLSRDSLVCGTCRRDSPLQYVWVAAEYEGVAKQLVRALKYERAKAAQQPIASFIARTLPYLPTGTMVTHLPTATSRERARGYDQSQLIARSIAHQAELPYAPLLARLGQTRQVGATRKQRQVQASQMFAPIKVERVQGASILLIDDILTTGASLEAAAKVLKKAGAKQVSAAVFAQKH